MLVLGGVEWVFWIVVWFVFLCVGGMYGSVGEGGLLCCEMDIGKDSCELEYHCWVAESIKLLLVG